jgi:hypothetical protein
MHGEDIRYMDARQITEAGAALLEVLRTLTNPVEKVVITADEVTDYEDARYRVTTVVPYVAGPERRTYVFTQDELDSFLEGYQEYAEFVVSLEKMV